MYFSVNETIGIIKPHIDIHTLGISRIEEILTEMGFEVCVPDMAIARAVEDARKFENIAQIKQWILDKRISILCFSYRLDPNDATSKFLKLYNQIADNNLLKKSGGLIKRICFAALPPAVTEIEARRLKDVVCFAGDENYTDTLIKMGINPEDAPQNMVGVHPYDLFLNDFGKDLINTSPYLSEPPHDNNFGEDYGTPKEKVEDRIAFSLKKHQSPLFRAHVGPYQEKRLEALKQFINWVKRLSKTGYLDVLSIGTSQLTQEDFNGDWDGKPNGGGIPIHSPEEYTMVYKASRPLLVRTYAGTSNIPGLAKIYEETINMAWHALSFWWFSRIDGRGPNDLLQNLEEHFKTLDVVAQAGKPFEPNIPHHFAFRNSDDLSYVVSAVLSAKAAFKKGIKSFILQTMLNTPKYTWGVKDLAKAAAILHLLREWNPPDFSIYLQTRAGLDYLSHRPLTAKQQLASVTALMDDIEPETTMSPHIIHVVSYSEGYALADPAVIDESIQITQHALKKYRLLKKGNNTFAVKDDDAYRERLTYLIENAGYIIRQLEAHVKNLYSPEGFLKIFKAGVFPVPQLVYQRDVYPDAVNWKTKVRNGQVDLYDGDHMIDPKDRIGTVISRIKKMP
ncbi:MAG: cobalamin-binding protein [Deltaproteobacteria bacterium]|nr:cobalamin-binding protein [Deltaproteobacteria bacterium]